MHLKVEYSEVNLLYSSKVIFFFYNVIVGLKVGIPPNLTTTLFNGDARLAERITSTAFINRGRSKVTKFVSRSILLAYPKKYIRFYIILGVPELL